MDHLLRSVRYAVRVLGRTPAFTATVVATLAVTIGANAAVFALIDAVLLEPLPFPEPDRLVLVSEARDGAPISNTAPIRIEEWNEASTTLAAITGYYTEDASETSGDVPEKFRLARVAPRFVEVWGVAPALGRGFTAQESEEGAAPVAIVSHRYWAEYLNGAPDVLERQVRLGDGAYSIVGVMPASFRFPDRDVDIFVPRVYLPWMMERTLLWYSAFARLEPGVTLEQARADLAGIQARLGEQYPETDRDVGVHVEPLENSVVGSVRGSLWIVFGAVTVLVLIAATNVAALLLARAARRKQEIAVRLSLGASRRSVLVQSLTETGVLAILGAALGLALAAALSGALRALVADLPRSDELALDGDVLLYTAVAVVAVTALCGTLPALRATRVSAAAAGLARDAGRTQVSSRHSLQWLFVGVQIAFAVVLLSGSGLLIRSLIEISRVEPGFDASRVLSFRLSGTYQDFEFLAPRVAEILDELAALPGVDAAAMTAPVPGVLDDDSGFQFSTNDWERLEGRSAENGRLYSDFRVVSPSYYETMQIPLVAGDLCRTPVEGAVPEVMVNRAFAARYSPATPLAGRTLYGRDVLYRIAGVVGDAREYGLGRPANPTVYPCRTAYVNPASAFLLRTSGDPLVLAPAVRAKLKELTPLRAVYDVVPLTERMGNEYSQDRLRTTALALFASVALLLATLGVYGTLTYVVSLRRREVGLRVALGARQREIVAAFVAKALKVVALACAVGVALSLAFSRLLAGMLYGVSSMDPLALGAVIALVTSVGAAAALVPALRAARVDPMNVLREE